MINEFNNFLLDVFIAKTGHKHLCCVNLLYSLYQWMLSLSVAIHRSSAAFKLISNVARVANTRQNCFVVAGWRIWWPQLTISDGRRAVCLLKISWKIFQYLYNKYECSLCNKHPDKDVQGIPVSQTPVAQRLDNSIHWINHDLVDSAEGFPGDLSVR